MILPERQMQEPPKATQSTGNFAPLQQKAGGRLLPRGGLLF
jgi:hypothetical protein